MSREGLMRFGGPAAMAGGALYLAVFGAVYLIYELFAQQTKGTFWGSHAFTHMLDVPMFALLTLGLVGVYLRESGRLGTVGKAGFYVTLAGFGLSVVGGIAIIVTGLSLGEKATMGILDVVTHPLAHAIYAIGSLIFGVATIRAGVLPRGGALLAAIGPVWLFAMFMAGFNQSFLLLLVPVAATALGWMWMGYALRSKEHAPELAEPVVG